MTILIIALIIFYWSWPLILFASTYVRNNSISMISLSVGVVKSYISYLLIWVAATVLMWSIPVMDNNGDPNLYYYILMFVVILISLWLPIIFTKKLIQ